MGALQDNPLQRMPTASGEPILVCMTHGQFWNDVFPYVNIDELIGLRQTSEQFAAKLKRAEVVWMQRRSGVKVDVLIGKSSCGRACKVRHVVGERATILNEQEYQQKTAKRPLECDTKNLRTVRVPKRG